MKTIIKSFLLGFISFLGCSCEVEDYTNGNTSYIQVTDTYVSNDTVSVYRVIPQMKGYYVGSEKREVLITDTEIKVIIPDMSIDRKIAISEQYMLGRLNCWIFIIYPDGTTIQLLLGWRPVHEGVNPVRNLLAIKINGDFVPGEWLERVNNF
jgi:hypothetical protein